MKQQNHTFKVTHPQCWAFSAMAILTFWDGSFYVMGGCPVYCRMFSSIFGLYLLNANSTPSSFFSMQHPNITRQCQIAPGGKTQVLLKTSISSCTPTCLGREPVCFCREVCTWFRTALFINQKSRYDPRKLMSILWCINTIKYCIIKVLCNSRKRTNYR